MTGDVATVRLFLFALALGLALLPLAGPAVADGAPPEAAAPDVATSEASAPTEAPQPAAVETGPNDVWVAPGERVAVRVALGHINRIETPFPAFDLWTESPEEFEQRGHVFYIAPKAERPISMFITPKNDERLAFSLMLIPEAIPPTEVRLRLGGAGAAALPPVARAALGGAGPQTGTAAPGAGTPALSVPSFETGPYEEGLTRLVKDFVVGVVPQGYGAAAPTGAHPRCRNVAALSTSFAEGQRFIGPAFEVFVGVATNGGTVARAFDETWCAGPDIAAVALWPSGELAPGARAEVVVVRRRAAVEAAPARMRASLVGAR